VGVVCAAGLVGSGVAVQPSGEPPLKGPSVRESGPGMFAGLRFTLDGTLRRGDARPEEAIVRQMNLDAATIAAVDRVFLARARLLESFVSDNLDLLSKIATSGAAGDEADVLVLLFEALGRLDRMGFEGRLALQVQAVLPEDRRGEYRARLASYWRAVATEKAGGDGRGVHGGHVLRAMIEEPLRLFGEEVEAAFRRAEASGDLAFRYVTADLGLSAGQEQTLRAMFREYMDRTGGNADEKEQGWFFVGVLAYLTLEQQEKLVRKFQGP
jgi:hypothetical protein